jgi:GNAT superfamily N-acetyltransferase
MTPDIDSLLVSRPGTPADHNYVIRTWAHGYLSHMLESPVDAEVTRPLEMRVLGARPQGGQFLTSWSRIAQGWLLQPTTLVRVLALKGDPRVVVAFAVVSRPIEEAAVLHWVYVQRDWRGKGLAHELLAPYLEKQISYTHATPNVRIAPGWTYASPIPPPIGGNP